jgi:dsDNA-specific endonuclease/ATPase MutS2
VNAIRETRREHDTEMREIEREASSEARQIEREKEAEKRLIQRERVEVIRQHWSGLQSNLILFNRIGSQLQKNRQFVAKNGASQDPTIRKVLETLAARYPELISEFGDCWGRIVAQLNILPEPKDALGAETLTFIQGIGKIVGDPNIEIKDEMLKTCAELAIKAADRAGLPS